MLSMFFRFGFALTNLGDINKDRYEDLAVGAPYEGKGVVYIYLGSKHGIITEPSQVDIQMPCLFSSVFTLSDYGRSVLQPPSFTH